MLTYKDSGVDRLKLSRFKENIFYHFLRNPGGFGGRLKIELENGESLFATIDGVGTKLKLLAQSGLYRQAGYDLVNHIAGDLAACGSRLVYFLDYISFSQLDDKILEQIGIGLLGACHDAGCELVAGETSQMPGYYPEGEFELVGVGIGIAENDEFQIPEPGDTLIALSSNGLHTNGYSLARKALFEIGKLNLDSEYEGQSLAHHLLKPHKLFSHIIQLIPENYKIKAAAHITGGGIPTAIARILPENLGAKVYKKNLPDIPIFRLIKEKGEIEEEEMFSTFNMGAGFVMAVPSEQKDALIDWLNSIGEKGFYLGEITDEGTITFEE